MDLEKSMRALNETLAVLKRIDVDVYQVMATPSMIDIWLQSKDDKNKDREALRRIARAFPGKKGKNYMGSLFSLDVDVLGKPVSILIGREAVCQRVVKKVTKPAEPAKPERVVEEIGWVCDHNVLETADKE